MTAEVMFSLAMIPHVRTINGYQSYCLDHPHDGDRYVIGETLEEGVWMGEWHEHFIDARLDAILHDSIVHPEERRVAIPTTPWWEL